MTGEVAVPALSIHYRLSELRPTAQRLRELVSLFGRWRYHAVYIDWGNSFPWSFDDRFRNPDAYREELVAGVFRDGKEIKVNSVFPAPHELEFVSRVASYQHLFRFEKEGPILDLGEPAGRKFYGDLVDDFLGLLADPGTVLLSWRERHLPLSTMVAALRLLRESGMPVAVRCCPSTPLTRETVDSILEDSEFVVVPGTVRSRLGDRWGERLVSSCSVATERDREAAHEIARRLPAMISVGPDECADIEELSSPAKNRFGDDPAGFLSESIELSLEHVRSLGESGKGEGALDVRRIGEFAAGLSLSFDEAWRLIRRIRESIAAGLERNETLESARVLLDRLHRVRLQAAGSAKDLLALMGDRIDPGRLQRALARRTGPLDEEYHMLFGRVTAWSGGFEENEPTTPRSGGPP